MRPPMIGQPQSLIPSGMPLMQTVQPIQLNAPPPLRMQQQQAQTQHFGKYI